MDGCHQEGCVYIVMPDGSICWNPDESDWELCREEQRDLTYHPQDDD